MSRHRKSSMNNSIKDRLDDIKEWIADHTKIVMPAILLICVAITVIIAVNANKKAAAEEEAQMAESTDIDIAGTALAKGSEEAALELPLEENAYPAVNALMSSYYEAWAEGDLDTIASANPYLDDTEKIRIQEMGKYIDSYPQLNVYTKAGPIEGSYLAYVYSKVKFTEYEELVPGMQAFYICTDENGNCYINEGEDNTVVTNYIRDISLQDDVVDLNNKIAVEYNELLEKDEELNAFLADLAKRIDVSVGEALAKAEAEVSEGETAVDTEESEEAPAAEETAQTTEEVPANVTKTVRVKEVVNVRSSDSETADKLGKAQTGEKFTLLEEKGNGWSKITYEGKDAFIKSEYLEVITEESAEQTAEATTGGNAGTDEEATVTVKSNVNIRKTASENGEKLGLAYEGEKLTLVMKQADGWTKIKFKGQTAYVKSDYVE